MSKLIIVRGLPGSGKSFFARRMAGLRGLVLIEPDAMLIHDGVYDYTPQRFADALDMSYLMVGLLGGSCTHPDCIYADVLPARKDVEYVWNRFLYVGGKEGKTLKVYEMPLLSVEESILRNRHGVREEDIRRMLASWEPWPGALSPEEAQ